MNIIETCLNNNTIPSKIIQTQQREKVKTKENIISNKTIATVAVGAATLAIVFAGIGLKNNPPKKLQDVVFKNGKAFLRNGEDFSGKIKDVLKNGDSVILEYKNGIIQKSNRVGSVNIKKVYDRSGIDEVVHIYRDGKETIVNLTKKINDTKKLIAENTRKRVEARAELQRRLFEEEKLVKKAREAQYKFNAPFEAALSHKSAEESATIIEAGCKRREELSQLAYNAPFEAALSHKSAEESAATFRTEVIKRKKSTLKNYYGNNGIDERTISSKNTVIKERIHDGAVHSRYVYYGLDGSLPNGGTNVYVFDSSKISAGEYFDGIKEIRTKKHYIKNGKGKHKIHYREKITSGPDNVVEQCKNVQQLSNGYSQTVIDDYKERTTKAIIRDKKGNIISEIITDWKKPGSGGGPGPEDPYNGSRKKLLAPWFKHYLELCQKFGESERPCGVIGGAWDHYIELSKWDADPDGMLRQILINDSRVEYDPKARLLALINNYGFNSSEVQQYIKMLKEGQISLDDILLFVKKDASCTSDTMKKILNRIRTGKLKCSDIADSIKAYLSNFITESQLLKKAGVPALDETYGYYEIVNQAVNHIFA